ncbi:MAG: GNAT family N-acetyltransferase [Planctomycetota bacterium]
MFTLTIDDSLALQLLEERHAAPLFDLIDASREHLGRWLAWVDTTRSPDDCRAFIRAGLQQFAAGKGVQAGIFANGQLAGVIGHRKLDFTHRKNELGFWLGASFVGRGIATRALHAMLRYAFVELDLNRSTIRCPAGHARARALAERCGFVLEGTIRRTNWLHDRYVDHALYGLLRDEWEADRVS